MELKARGACRLYSYRGGGGGGSGGEDLDIALTCGSSKDKYKGTRVHNPAPV